MADAGAIKAGDAYVEMALDKSNLDKGLTDAGKTGADAMKPVDQAVTNTGKRGEKAFLDIDKRAKQLASSLWRITGAMAVIHVAANAIGGAFDAMAARGAGDRAFYRGDLQGQVKAMRDAELAQESWMRSIPLLGGMLGKLFDIVKDRSIEDFAARIQEADKHGQSLAKTTHELAMAQIDLARAKGASPAELAALGAAESKRTAEDELGRLKEEYDAAVTLRNETQAAYEKLASQRVLSVIAGEKETTVEESVQKGYLYRLARPGLERKQAELGVLGAEATEANVIYKEKRDALKAAMATRTAVGERTKIEAEKLGAAGPGEMQAGAALAGAAPAGVAWGAGGGMPATPAEQLAAEQQEQSDAICKKLDAILYASEITAANTAKGTKNPYTVGGS